MPYSFPREDEGSPRQAILDKFCQDEVKQFRNCMNANNYDENKCLPTKAILDKCAATSFKKVNAEPEWIFWARKRLKGSGGPRNRSVLNARELPSGLAPQFFYLIIIAVIVQSALIYNISNDTII